MWTLVDLWGRFHHSSYSSGLQRSILCYLISWRALIHNICFLTFLLYFFLKSLLFSLMTWVYIPRVLSCDRHRRWRSRSHVKPGQAGSAARRLRAEPGARAGRRLPQEHLAAARASALARWKQLPGGAWTPGGTDVSAGNIKCPSGEEWGYGMPGVFCLWARAEEEDRISLICSP